MYRYERVFVDRESAKDSQTDKILKKLEGVPVEEVSGYKSVKNYVYESFPDPLRDGKKVLYLTKNRGEKIKKCPCTREKMGCGYFIINLHTNCPIDCAYCILQKYLNAPYITIFTNIDDYLEEIEGFLSKFSMRYLRVGTGELTDSLALDDVTGYSKLLIDFFSKHENTVLELKTKSDVIENVLESTTTKNTILSWSLNPGSLVDTDERLSATLEQRLDAAGKCIGKGFKVSFHFDPIVIYDGWQAEYSELIDLLFSKIDASRIEWISLGALRFDPSLKPLMVERFPKSKSVKGEFISGKDNKLRYLRNLRIKAFRHLKESIREKSKYPHLYLCMEDEELWKRVFKDNSTE